MASVNDSTPAPKLESVVLHTKLNRPKVSRHLLPRPRLLQLLDNGLEGALTLAIAPAGFGKTALIASWLETMSARQNELQTDVPAAWLSLDEDDNDLDTFLLYFVTALRTIFPDACPETRYLLNALNKPPITLLSATLSNEIEQLPSRFVLVLDDFQSLHQPAIFDLLAGWRRHWPDPLHLVILSRVQPPLPLADLRARGQLTEIRSRDLRFTPEESAAYLRPAVNPLLNTQTLALLQQRMEGWIAGLKLATLSLARQDDPQAWAQALFEGRSYVADYLLEQVFNQQSAAVQQFLLATAVPDRFSASLADALINGRAPHPNARALMDELEAADLFLTALDNRREWYRYHDLFRDFLRQRVARLLSADEINALHLRAADWYASYEQPDQALHHALQAGDLHLAAQVIQQGLCSVLNREDRSTLERWRRLLPPAFVATNPQLVLMEAWEAIFQMDFARMGKIVHQAALLLQKGAVTEPEQIRLLQGQTAVFRGMIAHHTGQQAEGITFCQEALTLLPEEWHFARGVAISYVALSMHQAGYIEEADAYLTAQYQIEKDRSDNSALRILLARGINATNSGDLENTERIAQMIRQKAQDLQLPILQTWSEAILGVTYYLWNELPLAEKYFTEVIQLRYATIRSLIRKGMTGLALTYQAQGKSEEALQVVEQLSLFDMETNGRETVETTAMRARLQHLHGDIASAERWADQFTALPELPLFPRSEEPYLIRACILIARGHPQDAANALLILDKLEQISDYSFNPRTPVDILALRALAEWTQGHQAAARQLATAAVQRASQGRIIRVFVELGSGMQALLTQIAGDELVGESVTPILAAFAARDEEKTAVFSPTTKPAPFPLPRDNLTLRELEILSLLAEHLTAGEIAERLVISTHTVKRHRANIYKKLGVNRLREALAVAEELGVLHGR